MPLDARLQLPERSFSYWLQDWAQALAVEFSFEHVGEVLGKIPGLKLGVSALERMNRSMAEALDLFGQDAGATGGGRVHRDQCGRQGRPAAKVLRQSADPDA